MPSGEEDFALVHELLHDSNIPLYNLREKAVKAVKALKIYAKIIEKH